MRRQKSSPILPESCCQALCSLTSFVILALLQAPLLLSRPVHGGTISHLTRPAEIRKGNGTAAFHAFELSAIVPNERSWKSAVFFGNGKSVCDTTSVTVSSCMADGNYSDRISFQFRFDPDNTKTAIQKPIVHADDGSSLHPEVKDFAIDKRDGSGSFAVVYKCSEGHAASLITLSMNVTVNNSAKTAWLKSCGSGKNKYLSMTFDRTAVDATSPTHLEAGPMQTSTVIQLKVMYPQTALDFKSPYVVSKNRDIGVKLRGTLTQGTLSTKPTDFVVIQRCQKNTRGEVTLTIAIPPWQNVSLTWTKDCGGQHPKKLLVSVGSQPVVNETGVLKKFNVTESTTLREAMESKIYHLGVSKNNIVFRITNNDKSEIHIQGLATTISNPDVLAVMSKSRLRLGSFVLQPQNSVIKKVDMVCLARGTAVVLVTLPILRYKNIEFGFYKECARPHVVHHSGFFQTASSLEFFIAILTIIGAIAGYNVYRRRTEAAKYQRVPQQVIS